MTQKVLGHTINVLSRMTDRFGGLPAQCTNPWQKDCARRVVAISHSQPPENQLPAAQRIVRVRAPAPPTLDDVDECGHGLNKRLPRTLFHDPAHEGFRTQMILPTLPVHECAGQDTGLPHFDVGIKQESRTFAER